MAALLDIVKKGSTDRSVTIRIVDSTDGTPETGVVFNTSGIDLWYRREGSAKVSITEADLATPALTDAHADGGFLHIGDGEYRLDLPDAAFATGANHVDVGGTVTGVVVIGGRVRLVDDDPEDAVRLGLTALPNAAADAAGGLPVSDAGGLDLDARLDAAISSRSSHSAADIWSVGTRALTDKAGFSLSSAGIQAIWDALTSALTTANSIGKLLVDNINATISSRLASSAAPTNFGDLSIEETTGHVTPADGAITAAKFGAGAIDAAALATDAAEDIATAVKAAGLVVFFKNTAFSNFMFKMVDETDLKTAETGLTVTATRSIDGGAFGAAANSVAEVSNGWYKINLAASDLNGDSIVLRFTATGAADREFFIAPNPLS